GRLRVWAHAVRRAGRRGSQHGAAGAPAVRAGQQPGAVSRGIPGRGGGAGGAHGGAGRTVAHGATTAVQRLVPPRPKHFGGPEVRCVTVCPNSFRKTISNSSPTWKARPKGKT